MISVALSRASLLLLLLNTIYRIRRGEHCAAAIDILLAASLRLGFASRTFWRISCLLAFERIAFVASPGGTDSVGKHMDGIWGLALQGSWARIN